jgi:hypothetical protein
MLSRTRLIEWGLPILLLILPVFAAVWIGDSGTLGLPVMALAIGLLLRPRHLWIIWLEVIVLFWLAGATWTLWGDEPAPGEPEETVLSFLAETVLFAALLALLPLFLGRLLGNWITHRRAARPE